MEQSREKQKVTEETETMNMKERQLQRKREMNRVRVREKEKSLGSNGKDKEWKLGKREEGRARKGKRDGARGVGRPCALSRAAPPGCPYIHPDFIYPPCIQRVHAFVCAVVKTHTTLTWLVPRRSWAQSDAAWRRRREVVPALTL